MPFPVLIICATITRATSRIVYSTLPSVKTQNVPRLQVCKTTSHVSKRKTKCHTLVNVVLPQTFRNKLTDIPAPSDGLKLRAR